MIDGIVVDARTVRVKQKIKSFKDSKFTVQLTHDVIPDIMWTSTISF